MDKSKLAIILKRIPLFKKLSETEITMILDMPKSYGTYNIGDTIMQEGEMEESFYILLNGEVSVWRHDKEIAKVAPPNFLGEVGFILGDPRVATVKAASDKVIAMKITAFHFKSLNSHIRECIKDKIIEGLVLRLNQTIDEANKNKEELCSQLKSALGDKYANAKTL